MAGKRRIKRIAIICAALLAAITVAIGVTLILQANSPEHKAKEVADQFITAMIESDDLTIEAISRNEALIKAKNSKGYERVLLENGIEIGFKQSFTNKKVAGHSLLFEEWESSDPHQETWEEAKQAFVQSYQEQYPVVALDDETIILLVDPLREIYVVTIIYRLASIEDEQVPYQDGRTWLYDVRMEVTENLLDGYLVTDIEISWATS